MNAFLAFDLGASSGRGILGTLENGQLQLREIHRFPNGAFVQDGSLYWDFPALCRELVAGLKKALEITPEFSIGIDTWGVDYVLLDRSTGLPRRLPFSYRDSRCERGMALVRQKVSAEDLYLETGIQEMPLNTVYQLAAHQAEHPEDLENAVLLPIPDALAAYLGGSWTAEYTIASTTALLKPGTARWNMPLIRQLGLPEDIFPEIVMPGTVCGTLRQDLAEELGCGALPLIKVASHDTASAVAAVPATEDMPLYISCGTWSLLGAELSGPKVERTGFRAGFTNEGGVEGSIRFLTNIMGSWLFQEIRRDWKEKGIDRTFAEMESMARNAAADGFSIDPQDSFFLAPDNMPERIRQWCRDHGQGEIPDDGVLLRTVYNSLANIFARQIGELETLLDRRFPVIYTVGGGTRDRLLLELTANAAGKDVSAGPVEATAIGNWMMQAVSCGICTSIREGRAMIRQTFAPEIIHPC